MKASPDDIPPLPAVIWQSLSEENRQAYANLTDTEDMVTFAELVAVREQARAARAELKQLSSQYDKLHQEVASLSLTKTTTSIE